MKPLLIVLFVGLCSCHLIDLPACLQNVDALKVLQARSPTNKAPQNSKPRPNQPQNYASNQRLVVKPGDDDYVFSWRWACNKKVSFDDCQALFYWNDELIAKILPTDIAVHRAIYNVKGRNGVNKLRIEGLGSTIGYGLIIDDVSIVKKGYGKNYVINGDFEEPNQNGGWNLYTNISGWTGNDIEIAQGKVYDNGLWFSQVCQLRGFVDPQLNQNVILKIGSSETKWSNQFGQSADEQQESQSEPFGVDNTFIFSWKWAWKGPAEKGQGLFYWNDKLIANITPTDSDQAVHTESYKVKGKNGINKLKIVSSGGSSPYINRGLSIDDVSLMKEGTSLNYVINGDFETPKVLGQWQGIMFGIHPGVLGWAGHQVMIGYGTYFNPQWTSQACKLSEYMNAVQLNQNITLKIGSSNPRKDRNRQGSAADRF